jgi:hypothetical protein
MDGGLNCLTPVNMLNPREAADGSYNIVYEKGMIRTERGLTNWTTATALNSGDIVLYIGRCRINLSDYLLAATTEKIYRRNFINSEWDDVTQSGLTMSSNPDYPVSSVVISHDDAAIYYNDNSLQANAYEHVVLCDGGLSNIQRWAGEGEADFADLVGAGGYSGGTTHRALQVGTTQNRLILLSPREYDSSSRIWVENRNRVRWPQVAKLESWTGTGSGAVDLRDTGGINVWSASLGGEYYIYQDNSIWNLRYVGGTAIFDPRPMIHNLGLLSHHLLVAHGNTHYFLGSDYNVWAYYGGTVKQAIGNKIRDFLIRDIEADHLRRCWIALDVNAERLGVFIVPDGGDYAGAIYWYDLAQQSWSKQDLTECFPVGGVTAVSLVGSVTGTRGETYAEALSQVSPYDISDAADATLRYGDVLCEFSRTLTSEVTNASWCAGGTYLYCATGAFKTDLTVGDIVRVQDGSLYTNCRYGTHYYSISDMSDAYITLNERDSSCAVTADPTKTPAGVPFTVWTDEGDSYAEHLEIYETEENLVIGDDSGFLYIFDASTSGTYDTTKFSAMHLTPVIDLGAPGQQKRWPGIRITARKQPAANDGQLLVYYRTNNFDSTAGSSWTRIDHTWSLDGTWCTKDFFINRTSPKIQFALKDVSGTVWECREVEIFEPQIQEYR